MKPLRESFFHVLLASYRPEGFERVYRSGDSKLSDSPAETCQSGR